MTDIDTKQSGINTREEAIESSKSRKASLSLRIWDTVQFLVAFCAVCAVLWYLIKLPQEPVRTDLAPQSSSDLDDVRILDDGDIHLASKSPLFKRLRITNVSKTSTTDPLFEVTGQVVASLRSDGDQSQWQFSSGELLTLFTDWQKAVADVVFTEQQLASAKELAQTKADSLKKEIERKKRLVKIGTDTEQELAASEAELLQVEIEERKNVYEAETAVRTAKKAESSLTRQLELDGLNPKLLEVVSEDMDIVVANVPGNYFNVIATGMECFASFRSLPDVTFSGKIREVIPVLSRQLRTLRVLFVVKDPKDLLRPGMFAEVGIGTNKRDVLTVPPESVVHIGDDDYVLARKSDDVWRITKIVAGNLHKVGLEVKSGLRHGDQVAGQGVILLKGYIAESLDGMKQGVLKTAPSETNNRTSEVKKVATVLSDYDMTGRDGLQGGAR